MPITETAAPSITGIARHFGIEAIEAMPLQEGLINTTLRLTDQAGRHYLMQRINTRVFPQPLHIQENYQAIYQALRPIYPLPALIPATDGQPLYVSEDGACWRCFDFVENSFTPKVLQDTGMAHTAAACFGKFTSELTAKQVKLHTILPRFHDLNLREKQLQQAIGGATGQRLAEARPMLDAAGNYGYLLNHYSHWEATPAHFPQRILHHDAKVSNILFHTHTQQVICPIDLDTTQSGLFFSDMGDMVRSMVPTHDENHAHIHEIDIQTDILKSLEEGYREATDALFTPREKECLPLSGQVLLYMQAIRFLADYLNNDVYYPIQYPGQNLMRAANQFRVLELLRMVKA